MCIPRHILTIIASSLTLMTAGSHALGGEIMYSHMGGHTYRIDVIYYTCLASPADRPEIVLEFGDGTMDTIPRISIVDLPSSGCCGTRRSEYLAVHTYPGPGHYEIRFHDPTRGSGIVNIPNSLGQDFCVTSLLIIDPALGPNQSVRFASAPTELLQIWSTWTHLLMPLDPDGDSLSFELISPKGFDCEGIAGYEAPSSSAPGWAWLDPGTGDFFWNMPDMMGLYTIAIQASEWRNNMLIGRVTRDMVLCISLPSTGMIDHHPSERMALRPSITDGTVFLTNPGGQIMRIEIHDTRGFRVFAMSLPPGEHTIDLGHLASGVYMVHGIDAKGVVHLNRLVRE